MRPLIENLEVEKNKRGLLSIKPTLQLLSHDDIFALGDIANLADATPTLAGTAELAFQEAQPRRQKCKSIHGRKETGDQEI